METPLEGSEALHWPSRFQGSRTADWYIKEDTVPQPE